MLVQCPLAKARTASCIRYSFYIILDISLCIMSCLWTSNKHTIFDISPTIKTSLVEDLHHSVTARRPDTARGDQMNVKQCLLCKTTAIQVITNTHDKHYTLHAHSNRLYTIVHPLITPIHEQQLYINALIPHITHSILTLHTTDIHHTQAHINSLTPHQRVVQTRPVVVNGDEGSPLWPVYHSRKQPIIV